MSQPSWQIRGKREKEEQSRVKKWQQVNEIADVLNRQGHSFEAKLTDEVLGEFNEATLSETGNWSH